MYLQFTQDGTVTHNRSFRSSQTNWMLTESKTTLILSTAPNDRKYKCTVEIPSPGTLIVKDAGCLPGYFDVNGMQGTTISYAKQ